MGEQIRDGGGKGFLVKVTGENQLKTTAEVHSIQHHVSRVNGETYQVIGDFASIVGSTYSILHLKNTNSIKKMCVSYIRVQAVGITGSTVPDPDSYFQIGFGTTYSSGGTATIPVVLNRTSGKASGVTAYGNNPTVSGTFTEFDRWYLEGDGKMMVFNKEGSLFLGQNDTMEIRFVSDSNTSAGTAYARVTFFLLDTSGD